MATLTAHWVQAQQQSASTGSMNWAAALRDRRKGLLKQPNGSIEPEGSLSRKFYERLENLQNSRESGEINHKRFVELAHEILADLMEHEDVLPDSHWKVANEDVYVQYREFPAQARAVEQRPVGEERDAQESVEFLRRQDELLGQVEFFRQFEPVRQLIASGRTTAPGIEVLHATVPAIRLLFGERTVMQAMQGGASVYEAVRQAVQQHDIRQPLHLVELLRRRAESFRP